MAESGVFTGCSDVVFCGKAGSAAESLAAEYAEYGCVFLEEE